MLVTEYRVVADTTIDNGNNNIVSFKASTVGIEQFEKLRILSRDYAMDALRDARKVAEIAMKANKIKCEQANSPYGKLDIKNVRLQSRLVGDWENVE